MKKQKGIKRRGHREVKDRGRREKKQTTLNAENAEGKNTDGAEEKQFGVLGRIYSDLFIMNKLSAIKTAGGCMRPLIRSGDMIFFETGKPPVAGDVVLFKRDGMYFTHRVVSVVSGYGYITVDDAGVTNPVFTPSDSVVGRCDVFPSGFSGLVWCFFSRLFFKICRQMKNIFAMAFYKILL